MCSIPAESDPCLQIIHFSRRDPSACRRFRWGAAVAGELQPALFGALEPGAGAVPRLGGQYELRRWGWSWLIGKRGVWVDAEEFAADGQPLFDACQPARRRHNRSAGGVRSIIHAARRMIHRVLANSAGVPLRLQSCARRWTASAMAADSRKSFFCPFE